MGLSHTLDDDGSDTDLFYVIYEHTRMVKLKIFELIWIVKDFVTRCVEESYLMKKIRLKINYIRKNILCTPDGLFFVLCCSFTFLLSVFTITLFR